MSELTTYSSLYIDNVNESISFFTKYLNYIFSENLKISTTEEWWILKKGEKEQSGLILIKTDQHHQNTLILSTHDSILEYCKLKEFGIRDLSKPSYTALGLGFSFQDPSGNKIMILEERSYNDLEI